MDKEGNCVLHSRNGGVVLPTDEYQIIPVRLPPAGATEKIRILHRKPHCRHRGKSQGTTQRKVEAKDWSGLAAVMTEAGEKLE